MTHNSENHPLALGYCKIQEYTGLYARIATSPEAEDFLRIRATFYHLLLFMSSTMTNRSFPVICLP